jgi:hypothetical protein
MRKATLMMTVLALTTLQAGAALAASGLAGTWSGNGYVVPKDGARENVRCRVRFNKQSSTVYSVAAQCEGSTTSVNQTGEVIEISGGRYAGDFYNAQYDISGRIRVQVNGNHQTVTFGGSRGQGSLSLTRQ